MLVRVDRVYLFGLHIPLVRVNEKKKFASSRTLHLSSTVIDNAMAEKSGYTGVEENKGIAEGIQLRPYTANDLYLASVTVPQNLRTDHASGKLCKRKNLPNLSFASANVGPPEMDSPSYSRKPVACRERMS